MIIGVDMSKNGFLEGFSSVFNLFPKDSASISFTPLADAEAYTSDSEAIAKDMNCAIHIFNQGNQAPMAEAKVLISRSKINIL